MIYLDNAATSPVDEEVFDAMLPYLREEYGNPSGKYYCKAVNAKNAVEEAREKVAALIGAESEEIIFTAGATESTNLVIKGFMDYSKFYGSGKNHLITSKAEHKATLNVCKFLNGEIYSNHDATTSLFSSNEIVDRGYSVTFLDVNKYGTVDFGSFESAVNSSTAMVSLIYVNNEIGSVNDFQDISDLCSKNNIALHVDATQALGKVNVDVKELNCRYMSMSAHKIYGPKGVGCAYIKGDKYGLPPMTSLLHGGEQENGIRAGTLAVHNIVGFGKAAEIAIRDMKKNQLVINELDDYLTTRINEIKDVKILIDTQHRVKGIVSLLVDRTNFNNERFIKKISSDIAVSTGSACSAGEPSHVIAALGQKQNVSKIIRISMNKFTKKEDIDLVIELLKQ